MADMDDGDMSQGTTTVTVSAPTRELIRDWQMQSETNIIQNAWRHGEYTWFAEGCALPPTNKVENMATVGSDNEEEDDETLTEETLTKNDRQPSPDTSVALAQLLDESSDEEERADTARLFGN